MPDSLRLQKGLICAVLLCAAAPASRAQDRVEPQSPVPSGAATNSNSGNVLFEVAPGLPLPPYGAVWILDSSGNKPKLIRIHPTNALPNRHAGKNLARSELPLMKQVSTLDLFGAAAARRIDSSAPAILIRKSQTGEEGSLPAANPATGKSNYVLLRLTVADGRRVLCSFSYWRLVGKPIRHEDEVASTTVDIAGGQWLKITPKQSLSDGEYAVVRMPEDTSLAGTYAYDFGVGPPASPAANP